MGVIELLKYIHSISREEKSQKSMLSIATKIFIPNDSEFDDDFIFSAIKQFLVLWTSWLVI